MRIFLGLPLFLFFIFTQHVVAQQSSTILRGFVMGEDFMKGVQGAHIYTRISNKIAISDNLGYFAIPVAVHDTLVISHVQYGQLRLPVNIDGSDSSKMMIRMKQQAIVLDNVDVFGGYEVPEYLLRKERPTLMLPGISKDVNPHPEVAVPIGSTQYGVMSYFTKEAKEKRKLIERSNIENKDSLYVRTISSDEVREQFMLQFGMSRKEFDEYILYFNEKYIGRRWFDRDFLIGVLYEEYMRFRNQRTTD